MERQPVHRRGHGVLAHAVVDIGACVFAGRDLDLPSRLGVVRRGKVGGAAKQFGNGREKVVQHGAARRAGRHLLAAVDKLLLCIDDRLLPVRRQNAAVAAFELAAQRVGRGFHSLCPGDARLAASGANFTPFAQERFGNDKRRRIPVEDFAGAGDLLLARRIAMSLLRASLGRKTEPDDRLAGNHRRTVGHGASRRDGSTDSIGLMAIDRQDMPTRGFEALQLIVGLGQAGRAVDRDGVVVPKGNQATQLEMPRQRNRFLADALHQAAVAHEDVSVVIDQIVAEGRIHDALAERHADRIGDALPERPRRRLDAVGVRDTPDGPGSCSRPDESA